MDQGLIPQRYARALYKVAVERQCAEPLYAMMKTLNKSFVDNPDLNKVMENPFVSDGEKLNLLLTGAGVVGNDVADDNKVAVSTFNDFVKLLCQNRRIEFVRSVSLAYIEIYRRERDIHTVTVTTASALDGQLTQRLLNIVKAHRPDGVFEVTEAVDPNLIGGFTIAIDNERLDASISNELKKLRLELVPNK